MPDYPTNIQLPSRCEEVTEDPAIRSGFETGIVHTRPRFTRVRRTWKISWEYIKGADYRVLRTFYDQIRGGALSFNWTHPIENKVFEVRFKGEIQSDTQHYDYCSVDATLEEV